MVRILVLSVSLAMLATPARAAGRNVVFFVADDHGTEALGAYGNRVVKTPGLDTFASEGVRFTHAFATTASCSASRSVLLTGVHNHRNWQYGHEHEYHHFSAFPNVRSLPVRHEVCRGQPAQGVEDGRCDIDPRDHRGVDAPPHHLTNLLDELYDLRDDPGETQNLHTDPKHRDVRDRLQQRLSTWQHSISDPLLERRGQK
jgi:arylsulfatase A-like enzyme